MPRKARSDSTHAQTIEAQREDTSISPIPTIAGMELLNETGLNFFAAVYRTEPAHFTAADLVLLVEAASVHQAMVENRRLMQYEPMIVTLNNGMVARNPVYLSQQDLSRQFQTLMRDLGVRSKDGFRTAPTASKTKAELAENVESFEEYLAKL